MGNRRRRARAAAKGCLPSYLGGGGGACGSVGAEGASPVCVAVLGVVGRTMRKGEARALGDGLLLPELLAHQWDEQPL